MCQRSDKMDKFDFFGPNLPKNELQHWKFKKIMLEEESASLRYYLCQILEKTDNFDVLGNFRKLMLEI